ncbi:MAG: N-acetylmuramoyl-L-alanine amidase [Selenomonadaceae bacterium]|nr:N-acetylmuramoyl-L-alanine amidase [Selenomonadaceae bacterium]
MERVKIIETDLKFNDLVERSVTDMIVIHHTGNPTDDDLNASEIHQIHLNQGWSGIGYHFVIRKDGTVERGRPDWAIGAHAEGENSHTIGIHICGNFEMGTPTEAQIENLALLIANLCEDYKLLIDRNHIVGHKELMSTACPGKHLFSLIDTIVGKAVYYSLQTSQNSRAKNEQKTATNGDCAGLTSQNSRETSQKKELPEIKIWRFFKEKGLNDCAVAGIMGNLYAESGLIPTNLQNSFESSLGVNDEGYTASVDDGSYSFERFINDGAGFGLAQWTYYTRKAGLYEFAKHTGRSIGDLDMQLEYLWDELQKYEDLMGKLRNAKSVREASDAFLLDFERPADQGEGQKSYRAEFADEFYEKYASDFEGEKIIMENEKRYNTIEEVPEWAKPEIEYLIKEKIIQGDGKNLDLSHDMLRIYVSMSRAFKRVIGICY